MSFPVGMVGYEDVCEIFGGFDLLLGLDCGVGHGGEGVGLEERGVPVVFIF